MDKVQFLKRAMDADGFSLSEHSAEAAKINPTIWDRQLREYEEADMVITKLAEQYDFRGPGADYKVTIDVAPAAAGALTETADVDIVAFSTRQTTFTPTEYGAAYQISRKEAVRSFFNVADRMVKKLGYALAQKKEALGYTCLTTYAGNSVFVNAKTIASDIASTDTLNYTAILNAIKANEEDGYTNNKYLVINYSQKQQLLNLGSINQAHQFGTRDAIQKGLIGELFGLLVFATPTVTTSNNVASAVVLAVSQTGEGAFGYAIKRDPIIEKDYHALGRRWDIVAHEEYDFQMLHPNAVCLIHSYA